MRYIVDNSGNLREVSFGAEISCNGSVCVEYTGSVPDGYMTLLDWYVAECEQLHRWKVVNGNLTLNENAVTPVEYCQADYVIAHGETDGWTWRKWASGISEAWGRYDVKGVACTSTAGSLYMTEKITPDMPFPDGLFIDNTEFGDSSTYETESLVPQLTFTSSNGTPGLLFVDSYVRGDKGAASFRIFRHSAVNALWGYMHYYYKGRWKN